MNGKKILKIFMMPQEFPCGEQSSCCGPVGQSEEEIQSLKSTIQKELGYEVEVLNVKNEDDVKNYPRIVQLLHSLGPAGLPIIALEDEVVSMGNSKTEEVLAAIQEKTEKKVGKENKMIENANSDEVRQESSDDSQPCCSSTQGDDVCCSGGGQSWKTLVFVVVILLAGGVAAHSLLTRSNETASVSGQAASFNVAGLPEAAGSSTEVSVTSEQPSEAVTVSCGITVDSLMSLERLAVDKKTVFILLAGGNEEADRSASAEVEAVVNKLSAKGKQVAAFTLQNNTEGYDQLVKRFSVQSLPCVIVAGRGCGAAAVSGEITEGNLLGAFVRASTPVSSCGPRSGSSCCPPRSKK